MTTIFNDIKYGCRMLAKKPGFTVAAIITLALGLTVNAVVFSCVSDFFLRPLPATDPENLVVIAQKSPQLQFAFPLSYQDFLDFRKAVEDTDADNTGLAQTFSGLMAYNEQAVHLSRTNEVTERTWVHVVSNNYFSVLGVQPLHGRLFLPTEGQREGEDPIIVLTHHTWQRRFSANPDIVGQSVNLNGLPFTIVGVTRPDFHGAAYGTAFSGFVPATMLGKMVPALKDLITGRGATGFFLMGRLRPGVSLDRARKVVGLYMSQLVKEYPNHHTKEVKAMVMRERMSRPSPAVANFTPLIVSALMGLAILVLIVAIANVANLLFARAADQERELAIRGALGASRWCLLRQLLVESVLLALGAGVVGTVMVFWLTPYLESIAPSPTSPAADLGTDWRLFVFTFIASLVTGIFTGLLPALKATKLSLLPVLKDGTRSVASTRHPWRSLLVTSQVAISVVVLICAGLAVRSLHRLSNVPLGFRSSNLLLASFDLDLQRYTRDQGRRFHTQLLEKVRTLPGVTHAALTQHAPFAVGGGMRGDIHAEGQPRLEGRFEVIPCIAVDEAFLETEDIAVLEGRGFRPQDDKSGPRVAIINRVLANHLWPNENAIGRRLLIGGNAHEVIGLIGACRYWSITDRNRPLVFRPLAQNYWGHLTLVIRTAGPSTPLRASVEQIVRQLDPDLPLYNVRTMEQQIASSPLGLMPMRMGATVAGVQGALALILAALGITGLVSFAVTQRTREIGIRMAMGARTVDVVRLVTHQSLKLTGIGLVCGMLLALACTHILAGLLYEVSPTDATVFIGVMLLVFVITLLACWLPTRRATKIDPMEALRYE